ncbi:MAG: phosphoribosylamine--glycine ligase [Kiloniellales bacterium]|nr:phosphoribosylamine--glycine ligase [Kiloniellales bacterium]
MRILVVGSGGREHALCWAIAASPLCDTLYCAPGNAGIAQEAECVAIGAEDIDGLIAFARDAAIDYVVVGPEAPLVAGLVDRLTAAGIKAFGPSAAAAVLEGSKGFVKDLCAEHGIPTAAYGRFTDPEAAKAFARERGAPIVVKADGLAAGKGVVIAETLEAAEAAVEAALSEGAFGAAGAEVVIEEFLEGEEASFFALVDGETALPLATAQDHKRAFDGDTGPNTGGMGAYSPAPVMTPELEARVLAEIIEPTVAAMTAAGRPYKGVLYAGLMITAEGPQLIEYNARFGDPECQVLVMRLMSDLLPALIATSDGVLKSFDLRWYPEPAVTVVMAAKGYPGPYEKGSEIQGLEGLDEDVSEGDLVVFHAGTKRAEDGRLLASGGRVLNVTALGKTVAEAQARAYAAIERIDWPGGFCRRDIAWRAVERERRES